MIRRSFITRSLGFAIAFSSGCAGSVLPLNPSPVPLGIWGGDHVTMTILATGTHVELDCAHGDFSGVLSTDSRNQFSVAGTFVREHGGPVREDQTPDTHPAMYAGSLQSNSMALTIRLSDTGDLIGSFSLVLGAQGRIVKCL